MTEDNPFELSKNKSRTNSPKRITLTPSTSSYTEKSADDFLEITTEYWETLKYGTYIKYMLINETEYKYGWIIKNQQVNTYKNKEGTNDTKKGIKLTNTLFPNATNKYFWFVPYEKIDKLFIKIEVTTKLMIQNMNSTINTLNINLKKITEYIKKLDERVKLLENK